MSQYEQEPPQHPAAAYYPAPAYAAAPPKDLTAMGVIAFSAATLATVFTAVNASVVGRAVRTGGENADVLDWSVAVYYLGTVLGGLALLAGWITGAMWLHRARKNAEAFNPTFHHTRSAGWAWGGWVCPIVNLWFPFQVVRDTDRAASPLGTSPVIGWWWGLWIAYLVLDRISSAVQDDAMVNATNASGAQGFAIFVALIFGAALAAWGLVLRRVTKEQHALMYGGRAAA
jgi:hypothetical protein